MITYADVMISEIERLVGRKLTSSESETIIWLSGWDDGSRAKVMRLIKAAYESGLRK